MALEIKILDYGDIEFDRASWFSAAIAAASVASRPMVSSSSGDLAGGGDTGYRHNQIMETLGMRGLQFHENMIENQLARHGVRMGDVRYVLHTHLHIDHAGKDELFPMTTTVIINRRELEYSVLGRMHPQYPAPDIKHLIDPVAHPRRASLRGSRSVGAHRAFPRLLHGGGRGPHRRIDERPRRPARSRATICGDVIYDFNDRS